MTCANNSLLYKKFILSENVIARKIGEEILLVPLHGGMVNGEDPLFTLSPTGQEILSLLDGVRSLEEIIDYLAVSYDGDRQQIQEDVLGFIQELLNYSLVEIK